MLKLKERIPVANVIVGEEEVSAVSNVVKSGWLSMGSEVKEFEKEFCEYTQAKFAIAANSGTSALHAILVGLEIGPGDEVILPSLTFISTANVVLYQNAKPVLVECDPKTYNIDAKEAEKHITKKTKAIIGVDMNGMPFDYDEILKICRKCSIHLIADSAESLGAEYKGKKIGSVADIHCFSFFPNKNITTGEGGMVTVNSRALAEKIRQIINQGQDYRYHHIRLGYNYRMTNIMASIGRVQLRRIEYILSKKEEIAKTYNAYLKNIDEIKMPRIPEYVTRHAWYMYAISLKDKRRRDYIVKELEARNIETRLSFPPIHIQPLYRKLYSYTNKSLPITFDAWSRLIDIPIWANMGRRRQMVVINTLKELLQK